MIKLSFFSLSKEFAKVQLFLHFTNSILCIFLLGISLEKDGKLKDKITILNHLALKYFSRPLLGMCFKLRV